jgi:hypothetical protein
VPLVTGLWLSYSRGALAAFVVGLLALAALALTKAQLRAIGIAVVTGVPAAVVADKLSGVRALEGARTRDGAVMLAVLVALCALAACAVWFSARLDPSPLTTPRWARIATAVAVVVAAAGVVAFAARDSGHSAAAGASAQRLKSLESNRYDYWKVAIEDGFAKHPVKGTGAGGFAVIWLQHRDVSERAKVAHSLYVETLAELGLPGFAVLLMFVAGVALVARQPGPAAALVAFATHSALDWDWQMPAVTLVALVLAGSCIAAAEAAAEARPT